jgi:hypothetical protein
MTETKTEGNREPTITSKGERNVRIACGVLTASGIVAVVLIARHLFGALTSPDLVAIINRHGPAVLGIPAACAAALILVGLVRTLDGRIALDMLGVKADGAGATAIIWIATFLAIILSIRALW